MSVAGFALPGNYVDVMVNMQQEQGPRGASQISMTVLEHVLVLAIAQEAGRDDTKPKVVSAVTLELSPADAEKLDLARSVGSLSLVLRNQLDKNSAKTNGTTREQLLGIKEAVADVPPIRRAAMTRPVAVVKAHCVEVIRSNVMTRSR